MSDNNVIDIKNPNNVGNKLYHLCSEGNRRIIQSSVRRDKLVSIVESLNKLQVEYSGVTYEKFFIIE
jgi:hypothetical protein